MTVEEYYVSAEGKGKRLDVYLAELLGLSRSHIQGMLQRDLVLVNKKKGKANYKVNENDFLQVTFEEAVTNEVNPENIPLSVLYEDQHIIIVDKARGMVVHPATGNYTGTLVNALLYHCKDLSGINGELRPGIVHRLDKDTSGVMVAAKNDKAHVGLAEQIKEHSARRTYYALVQGNIVEAKGCIKAGLGRHPKDRLKMTVLLTGGKEAITHFTVLERFGHHTLIECVLETGRTHQIRVHMAYIGHPVVNDPLYGYRKMDFPIEGQALHSRTLDLVHPITKEALHVEAPLPQDFLDCLALAKDYRR